MKYDKDYELFILIVLFEIVIAMMVLINQTYFSLSLFIFLTIINMIMLLRMLKKS